MCSGLDPGICLSSPPYPQDATLRFVYTERKRTLKRSFSLIFTTDQCEHEINSLWTHLYATWLSFSSQYKLTLRTHSQSDESDFSFVFSHFKLDFISHMLTTSLLQSQSLNKCKPCLKANLHWTKGLGGHFGNTVRKFISSGGEDQRKFSFSVK